jgi:16S rRNA processing protein RimM
MTAPERVEVGRVVKAHGLRGEVAVHLLTDVPDRLAPGVPVRVAGRDTIVATSRPHQGRMLVRFEHIRDRTAAEGLRGASVEADAVAPDDLDVYLVSELVGRPVVDRRGVGLGTVTALVAMPPVAGYDLLEVTRDDGTTWLLPAADELVTAVEGVDGLHLEVGDLPEGLVDPSAADAVPASGSGMAPGHADGSEEDA